GAQAERAVQLSCAEITFVIRPTEAESAAFGRHHIRCSRFDSHKLSRSGNGARQKNRGEHKRLGTERHTNPRSLKRLHPNRLLQRKSAQMQSYLLGSIARLPRKLHLTLAMREDRKAVVCDLSASSA